MKDASRRKAREKEKEELRQEEGVLGGADNGDVHSTHFGQNSTKSGETVYSKLVIDRTPFLAPTISTCSNIWKACRPCALIGADNALALSNIYSAAFNTHQMVRDCAASASSLLDLTRQHFVAITFHAETNFIGDLFFIFAAFYVKNLLPGLFVKGSAQEGRVQDGGGEEL